MVTPKILRIKQVIAATGLCRSSIFRHAASGQFPSPRKLTPHGRASGWCADEVYAWIEAHAARAPSVRSAQSSPAVAA